MPFIKTIVRVIYLGDRQAAGKQRRNTKRGKMAENAEAWAAVAHAITTTIARWGEGATLGGIRADFEALLAGPLPVPGQAETLAGLPALRFVPPGAREDALVLFFHGGGFQVGSTASHACLMSGLAAASGATVLGVDYRLAPEHRFPAAHEDAFAAYAALASGARVVLAGDSAGGHLALSTALRARGEGLPMPAALVLISPWLDPEMAGESYTTRAARDIFSKPEALRAMARTYVGRGGDAAHAWLHPLRQPFTGLPPLLVQAGDDDITRDDSFALLSRAQQAGVACTLRVWPGMCHHFQVFDALPEAREALREIGAFIRAL